MCPARMSKIEGATRLVLAFNEAFNRHDVAGILQLMSDDCVIETAGPAPDGDVYKGKKAITQFWQEFFSGSPQAHIEIEDIFGLGLRCVMHWKYEWVNESGKKEHVRGVDIFQVKEGLISEMQSYVKG